MSVGRLVGVSRFPKMAGQFHYNAPIRALIYSFTPFIGIVYPILFSFVLQLLTLYQINDGDILTKNCMGLYNGNNRGNEKSGHTEFLPKGFINHPLFIRSISKMVMCIFIFYNKRTKYNIIYNY